MVVGGALRAVVMFHSAVAFDSEELDAEVKKNIRKFRLEKEYKVLQEHIPRSMYILPAFNSMRVWFGVLFVRQGWYKDGIFHFRIQIPQEYPNAAPSIFFLTPVFHPLVDPSSGYLDLSVEFSEWKASEDYIIFTLAFLKKIFYRTECFSSSQNPKNPRAAELFQNDKPGLITEIVACVKHSRTAPPPSGPLPSSSSSGDTEEEGGVHTPSILFSEFDQSTHGDIMAQFQKGREHAAGAGGSSIALQSNLQRDAFLDWLLSSHSSRFPSPVPTDEAQKEQPVQVPGWMRRPTVEAAASEDEAAERRAADLAALGVEKDEGEGGSYESSSDWTEEDEGEGEGEGQGGGTEGEPPVAAAGSAATPPAPPAAAAATGAAGGPKGFALKIPGGGSPGSS
uniref:UBC core domain-containing protein n=1 Tax=Chromera velia CCMP2878 TaxID=1169474 RepID=A0A0G4GM39_9ALVE|eukprot:Cvel_4904.t1-p1 / transcript=Cvel_4904.t1 / gene=Cvel_4904 / organism=Chromera_velia_CCMP2878 / gene_product=Protein crossbronx homolog, putative / transcript_product=Protein crossbronx homolog, putative / location=Cvel_scaffold221:37584-38765(+) / protein_length=394 / sequence_SO=supercontig / SO=protein_coding / is_pseudo=false